MNVLEIYPPKSILYFWVFLTLFLKILNRILRYFEEPLQVIWCYRNFYLEHMHGSIKIWPSQHLYWSVSHEDRRTFFGELDPHQISRHYKFIFEESRVHHFTVRDPKKETWRPLLLSLGTQNYFRLLQDKNVNHFTSLLLHIYFYVKSLTTHLVGERSSSKSNFSSMSPFFYMIKMKETCQHNSLGLNCKT